MTKKNCCAILNGTKCPKSEVEKMKREKIDKIKQSIEQFFDDTDTTPSIREISLLTGIPKSTVQRYVALMELEKLVIKTDRGIETSKTTKTETNMVRVARIGTIPCGPLSEEEEYVDGYVKLPRSFTGNGEFYLLTASGDSMIEAGIDDGDLVLIKAQNHAKYGDIIVALADGKNTLKRYLPNDKERKIILHPENKDMEDIVVTDLFIQGVATKVIKSL